MASSTDKHDYVFLFKEVEVSRQRVQNYKNKLANDGAHKFVEDASGIFIKYSRALLAMELVSQAGDENQQDDEKIKLLEKSICYDVVSTAGELIDRFKPLYSAPGFLVLLKGTTKNNVMFHLQNVFGGMNDLIHSEALPYSGPLLLSVIRQLFRAGPERIIDVFEHVMSDDPKNYYWVRNTANSYLGIELRGENLSGNLSPIVWKKLGEQKATI
jgi:hypothetical protein